MSTLRTFSLLAIAAPALAACNAISDFGGAEILLNVTTTTATATGEHLELWARDSDQNVIRILDPSLHKAFVNGNAVDVKTAFAVTQAVSIDDPCMIDDAGNLLWQPAAQTCGGTSRADCQGDAAQQALWAQAVKNRITQITTGQPTPMLAFVAWDDAAGARPTLAADAPAATRLQQCRAYWDASPTAYSGNPLELVTPVHGTFYGAVDYMTQKPATLVGGIVLKTDFTLDNLQELWLTRTAARIADVDVNQIDCKAHPSTCRGSIFVAGPADATSYRGVVHFVFPTLCGSASSEAGPCVGDNSASPRSGSATVYVRLDNDPVQF